MKLSIIVLTYNALEYTKKCLKSISQSTVTDYELIVVDNKSTDGTQKWLKNQEGISNLVLSKKNLGVAGGRNRGLEEATGEYVVFLDNDTEVGMGWETKMLAHFKNNEVGVVGKSGTNFTSLDPLVWEGVRLVDGVGFASVVAGFCFMFKRSMLDVVGWQWEDFPNGKFWHEDLEFCYRIRLAGYKIVMDTTIPIIHYEHKSMGDDVVGIQAVQKVDGFYENAKYIKNRMRPDNVITYYRTWEGFDSWSSYDRIARGLINALRGLGVVVVRKWSIEDFPKSFNLCKGVDFTYKGFRFVTQFLENDIPPKDWEYGIENVDYIFAGSHHVYKGLKDYKEKVIDLSPVGIEVENYNFDIEPVESFFNDKFVFYTLGASQPRKNTLNLIKWYCEMFTNRDNVILVIKDGDYGHRYNTENYIKEMQKNPDCPLICHMFEHLDTNTHAGIYKNISTHGVFIAPHKAEGFGMPHIEALACGCRVATSNFGGTKFNFIDDNGDVLKGVTLFNGAMQPSSFHNWTGEPYYKKNETPMWFEPNENEVKEYMKSVINEPYNIEEMKKSSQYIVNEFDYNVRAKRVLDKIKELTKGR